MFTVTIVDTATKKIYTKSHESMKDVEDVCYWINGNGSCDCNRRERNDVKDGECTDNLYVIVDYQATFPVIASDFAFGLRLEGYQLSRADFIRYMNDHYSDEIFTKAMGIYQEATVKKVLDRRNQVSVDKGALQMVVNILERHGCKEAVQELLATCVDIEDDLLPWYAENKPEEYMKHVRFHMVRDHM